MEKQAMKQHIDETVEALRPELLEISQYIFQHPEVAHTEHKACAKQVEYLKSKGYEITLNPAGVDTAFVATYKNGEGPHIAVLSEYDCLPNGLDHACGHNLIAAASMGAGAAMIDTMKKYDVKGTFSIVGTPYEETDGGKIDLLHGGVFDDIDACMAVHPTSAMSRVAGECLCSCHYVIEYHGQSAHSWARPWKGKNAFDAAIVFFNAVAMMRQQTEDGVRMAYGFLEGYAQEGSVPDYTKLTLGIAAPTPMIVEDVRKKVEGCIEAGAIATGCTVKYHGEMGYKNRIPNGVLGKFFRDNCIALGEPMQPGMPADSGGEDLGNVSHVIPAINPHMTILPERKISNHTVEFRNIVDSPAGEAFVMLNSKTLADTALDLLLSPESVQQAKEELQQRLKDLYGDQVEKYVK